jgi:hypothetical protein
MANSVLPAEKGSVALKMSTFGINFWQKDDTINTFLNMLMGIMWHVLYKESLRDLYYDPNDLVYNFA